MWTNILFVLGFLGVILGIYEHFKTLAGLASDVKKLLPSKPHVIGVFLIDKSGRGLLGGWSLDSGRHPSIFWKPAALALMKDHGLVNPQEKQINPTAYSCGETWSPWGSCPDYDYSVVVVEWNGNLREGVGVEKGSSVSWSPFEVKQVDLSAWPH